MKEKLKRLVNGAFAPFGLRIISSPRDALTGRYLFEDLGKLIGSPSPIILDVGANSGQTIDALLDVFVSPKIYAFEPSSIIFRDLESKCYPENVQIYNYGLGARSEVRSFRNYRNSLLSSFLDLSASDQNPFRKTGLSRKEKVRIETVDSFLESQGIKQLNLLKIDTQGFEMEVLRGAGSSFKAGQINFVQLEMNFFSLYEGQATATELIAYLTEAGFVPVDFYEKAMRCNRMAWCTALFGHA
ncbi:hypothetical protein CKO25_10495 [Thiocapsa imhoffii]|uniref:Methyltransferase FkbM domain-containing protein n=1 Tax=Thiocapsa imhoffii TaxID=382777 RepID=A0A9X0WIA2_9GAMM|nr:FkbM family methyltransferase [Thiocapsa imhoffii]MBK1645073.1 hypothetical protein [Thiocapsa imhoffii]